MPIFLCTSLFLPVLTAFMLIFAPAARRMRTHSTCPLSAAHWRGVFHQIKLKGPSMWPNSKTIWYPGIFKSFSKRDIKSTVNLDFLAYDHSLSRSSLPLQMFELPPIHLVHWCRKCDCQWEVVGELCGCLSGPLREVLSFPSKQEETKNQINFYFNTKM